mmetsp:Transcript_60696/g.168263  ORF Transcript_60696/g.168263 Transcript_60696/m.168263 type:complete len:97 (-) Transcript_60696:198-488(-)
MPGRAISHATGSQTALPLASSKCSMLVPPYPRMQSGISCRRCLTEAWINKSGVERGDLMFHLLSLLQCLLTTPGEKPSAEEHHGESEPAEPTEGNL